ncbi:MAG: hypothetical protein KTR14_09405 [Vampirovibrio sp.]|nr:hypothetical protein [Vampirovibrio sp.]
MKQPAFGKAFILEALDYPVTTPQTGRLNTISSAHDFAPDAHRLNVLA